MQYLVAIKLSSYSKSSMTDSPRYLFKLEIIQSSSMAPNGVRLKPNIKVRPVRKMPLFSRSGPKTPQELVKSMKDALQVLKAEQPGSKKGDKVSELVATRTRYTS